MAVNSDDNGRKNNEGEIKYESDPEDAKMSLKARRRVASDDEDDVERLQRGDEKGNNRPPSRLNDVSDVESEGAVAEYDDAFGEDEDYSEEREREEEEYEEDYDEEYSEDDGVGRDGDVLVKEDVNDFVADGKDENSRDGEGGEERKEAVVEPFSVPTAGAFYMHDNRFRGNARRGKHRRTIGGRRLTEFKDDNKWGHDKFEELTTNERRLVEHRRGSRGRSRGRGRAQGSRDREISNDVSKKTQHDAPMSVKGRGPLRYQPSFKNKYEAPISRNKQYRQSDKTSRASSVSSNKPVYNAAPTNAGPERKQVASSLNIASPPFYPTGSSTKDNIGLQQREVRDGAINQSGQATKTESYKMMPSTSAIRGKKSADTVGMEKLSVNDSNVAMSDRPANMQMPQHYSSSRNSGRPQLRGQGRGMTSSSQMAYQLATSNNLVDRVPPAGQLQNFHRNPGKNHADSSVHGSGRSPSLPKAAGAVNEFESGVESASASGKYKTSLSSKGRGAAKDSGKGSVLSGASQVMSGPGNITGAHGDPNFPNFLPFMQFGDQHPRGIGVPAVGMAFPGYVGRGNSEMTWLPVLAGAAGALGSPYCPPYINVDGSYNARPSGQTSPAMSNSSIDNNVAKVGGDVVPAQRNDHVSEDLSQRQKNTRRYTEMKFSRENRVG